MTWTVEEVHQLDTTTGTNRGLVHDGKFIWVISSTPDVKVIDFWGPDKPEVEVEKLRPQLTADRLTEHTTVTISGNAQEICYGSGYVYVLQDDYLTLTQIDVNTFAQVDVVLPEVMHSNIEYAEGNVWVASKAPEDDTGTDVQYLYTINVATLQVSSGVEIPTRKQTVAKRDIKYGLNGYIYVTDYNNVSCTKFTASTGAFHSTIRVNREPRVLSVSSDKNIWVSSYGGMLSLIDDVTDAVTHPHGTTSVGPVHDDGTYIWAFNPLHKIMRITKADQDTLMSDTDTGGEDYEIVLDGFDTGLTQYALQTPTFTYQSWNGTSFDDVQVQPYLIILSAQKINIFKNDNPFYRQNLSTIKAAAMISTGSEDYTGD